MILKSHTNTKTFEHEYRDINNRFVRFKVFYSENLIAQLAAAAMGAVNLGKEEDLTDLVRFCQTGKYELD